MDDREGDRFGRPDRVARPRRPARVLTPCERELEERNAEIVRLGEELGEKNDEIGRLKKQVAELQRELKRPYPGPPAAPPRPFYGETPWDKRPGGPGSGP